MVLENKENLPNEKEDKERPIDEDVQKILGKDPFKSKTFEIKIHSEVHKRWKYWAENGLEKEEREQLLEKYGCPTGMEVPKLNPEILMKLEKHSKARD